MSADMIGFREYQYEAEKLAIYPNVGENIVYPTLGLVGEAGEIANKVKKITRDDGGEITEERADQLLAELGDVLWYVAMIATELRWGLDYVAQVNLARLQNRAENGTLQGDGDER